MMMMSDVSFALGLHT